MNEPVHVPQVFTDGGPWATHDQACAVCWVKKAVLDVGAGRFQPCWECQRDGWRLTRKRAHWWTR